MPIDVYRCVRICVCVNVYSCIYIYIYMINLNVIYMLHIHNKDLLFKSFCRIINPTLIPDSDRTKAHVLLA